MKRERMNDMESQRELLNYRELWKEGNVKKGQTKYAELGTTKKGIVYRTEDKYLKGKGKGEKNEMQVGKLGTKSVEGLQAR